MKEKLRDARLKSNGKNVKVYHSYIRNTFIDFSDCKTEYKREELEF